jgi:sugar/nucleoside kinase (ribokinase family)
LARLARAYPAKPFAADSRLRIGEFEQVAIKPNLHEAQLAVQALGFSQEIFPASRIDAGLQTPQPGKQAVVSNDLTLATACGSILYQKNQKPVFVTLGALGILVVTGSGIEHIPGIKVTGEIDIVGAGDSVMAGLMAALGAGGTAKEAAIIGNLAASLTIQQLGTTGTATRPQLRQRFSEVNTPSDPGK